MAEIKWIKLSVNMFDDEKIKLIRTMPEGESIVLIWVQLLCLAGRINDSGLVYMGQNLAYSDEMLATILDHPLNVMRIALSTLEQFNMIDIFNDGRIDIVNWEKHQSTDKMSQIKEQNRIRQQRYYYRNKLRELGYSEEMPEEVDKLKEIYEELEANVRQTLPNDVEVRSKKLEVRSKKLEVNNSPAEAEPHIPYKEIVDYLNLKAGTKYRHTTKKTKELIKARVNEGFELEDFKQVIDNKTTEWLNDKEMSKYLRPETLFGTKFESYLNQLSIASKAPYQESVPEWFNEKQEPEEVEVINDNDDEVLAIKERLKEMMSSE